MPQGQNDARPAHGLSALAWLTFALCMGAAVAMAPLWVPLVLAAWTATIAGPLHRLCQHYLHRRKRAAGLLTVLLVLAILAPVSIALLSLTSGAIDLGHRLTQSKSGADALRSLAQGGDGSSLSFDHLDIKQWLEIARRHGASALSFATTLFGAATAAVVGVVVFVSAFYVLLVQGKELHEWLLEHAPLQRGHFHRLSEAFNEVGRGLLVGMALTGLAQGVVATIGYVACGVPQALVLGLATVLASFIPSIGAALVWAPVTLGLLLTGRPVAALVLFIIGSAASLVDNVLRPLLSRYGQLNMHGLLLFVAMLGGIAIFGAGGLLLGPLLVRLAIEGLKMLREAKPTEFVP
jgi:predicted PurR-regulated permease PerM